MDKKTFVITKQYKIISGHKRYMSMKNLSCKECEVRIIEPGNKIIFQIEFNCNRI